MRVVKHRPLAAAAVGILAAAATSGGAMAADCSALLSVTTADSTVSSAAAVAAGTVVGGASAIVDFCRVTGVARPSTDSEIKWEVWLPATPAAWTGRMKVNGTGAYAGATPYARLAQDVGDGFISAGSNMGHDGGESPAWTLNHPEKVKDWGLRAHYSVATMAKALATARFGRPVRYSYFEGCSNGGRQAMMMAQNYPELFDGIVAGAPSMFYPDLLAWLLWTGKQLKPTGPNVPDAIPLEKRQLITQRVLAKCDALDGVTDGQINDPRACRFDINTLGPAGDGSLTAGEVATAKAMYDGTRNELTGERRYSGAQLGGEADWSPTFADVQGYGPFIGHFVYSRLDYDWRTEFNWSTAYDQSKAKLEPITSAPSPDLTRFIAHGGKLLQMHGWNDAVVPPEGSIGYYYSLVEFEKLKHEPDHVIDREIAKLDTKSVATAANGFADRVHDYHRLFMLPATAHCGNSTGANSVGGGMPEPPAAYRDADHHAVSAVIRWVEQGRAPDELIATKFQNGQLVRSTAVCAFPNVAVYNGIGSANDAANFHCEKPKPKDTIVTDAELIHVREALTKRKLELPNR